MNSPLTPSQEEPRISDHLNGDSLRLATEFKQVIKEDSWTLLYLEGDIPRIISWVQKERERAIAQLKANSVTK